jgi:hypothetical protein
MAKTIIELGHNEQGSFEQDSTITRSEEGYQFQFRLTRKLLERLAGFSTVRAYDIYGNAITLSNLERRGPDGGLDLLIRLTAKTRMASRQTAGKVWRIIEEL